MSIVAAIQALQRAVTRETMDASGIEVRLPAAAFAAVEKRCATSCIYPAVRGMRLERWMIVGTVTVRGPR